MYYVISIIISVTQLSTQLIPFIATKTPDGVLQAFEHALFAKVPRVRYLVGRDARLLSLVSLFPAWMNDLAFNAPFIRAIPEGLNNKPEVEVEKKDE